MHQIRGIDRRARKSQQRQHVEYFLRIQGGFFTRSTVQCFPCHKYARTSISSLPAKMKKKNLQNNFQSCNAIYRSQITLSIIIQVCWKWRIILCISHLIVEKRHLFDYHKVSWHIQYNITAVNRVQCQSFFSQVLYAYIFSRQNRWLVAVNLIHCLDSPLNGLSLNWIPLLTLLGRLLGRWRILS